MIRAGARAPRFLWKTDAEGRFIDVTHVLADVAGDEASDIIGRTVEEVVFSFGLDPAFAVAIAARKSFAGVEADWPLAETAPARRRCSAACRSRDAVRRFAGFQGYGVMRLDRAFLAAPFTEARPPEIRLLRTPRPSRRIISATMSCRCGPFSARRPRCRPSPSRRR